MSEDISKTDTDFGMVKTYLKDKNNSFKDGKKKLCARREKREKAKR